MHDTIRNTVTEQWIRLIKISLLTVGLVLRWSTCLIDRYIIVFYIESKNSGRKKYVDSVGLCRTFEHTCRHSLHAWVKYTIGKAT